LVDITHLEIRGGVTETETLLLVGSHCRSVKVEKSASKWGGAWQRARRAPWILKSSLCGSLGLREWLWVKKREIGEERERKRSEIEHKFRRNCVIALGLAKS